LRCRGAVLRALSLRHNWPRKAGAFSFDEKLAWEKPCGGGVTHKALQRYPFLAEAGSKSSRAETKFDTESRRSQPTLTESCRPLRVDQPCGEAGTLSPAASGRNLFRAWRSTDYCWSELAAPAPISIRSASRASNEPTTKNEDDWHLTTPDGDYRASYVILARARAIPSVSNSSRQFLPAI